MALVSKSVLNVLILKVYELQILNLKSKPFVYDYKSLMLLLQNMGCW